MHNSALCHSRKPGSQLVPGIHQLCMVRNRMQNVGRRTPNSLVPLLLIVILSVSALSRDRTAPHWQHEIDNCRHQLRQQVSTYPVTRVCDLVIKPLTVYVTAHPTTWQTIQLVTLPDRTVGCSTHCQPLAAWDWRQVTARQCETERHWNCKYHHYRTDIADSKTEDEVHWNAHTAWLSSVYSAGVTSTDNRRTGWIPVPSCSHESKHDRDMQLSHAYVGVASCCKYSKYISGNN